MTRAHVVSRRYEPDLANVARARAWIVEQLRDHIEGHDRVVPDVELVLSELMTNAIKAGATQVSVELQAHPTRVLVSVEDDAGGRLTIRTPSPTAPGGRGLPIVAALSTEWGVDVQSAGKRVWASLTTDAV
jgi:anti-sigma regulatory factor (Ser/Thr protein kinase)